MVNSPKRNRRAGVEDRWKKTVTTTDPVTGKVSTTTEPSSNDGVGRRWRARWVDDEGKERSKAFDRKIDAQKWVEELTTALFTGNYVDAQRGRQTIEAAHRQWSSAQSHIKATTAATREVTWKVHVKPRWGAVAVADVQTPAVRAWVAEMKANGAGAATMENALGVLRMTLEFAIEDHRLTRNPCAKVKVGRREHQNRGYLNHSQVESVALAVGADATVVRFLAYTGLRWGEMAALKVESFDMLRRRVNVRQAVAEVKGEVVWSTAKNHERRSVPFPRFLSDELAALMRGRGRDELVFTAPAGGVLRVSTWRPRVFAKAVSEVQARTVSERHDEERRLGDAVTPEFPTVTPHDLRHTAASLAISAGANVKAVQTMLGHKSAALTLDTYADLFPDDLEAVADALDAAAMASRRSTADSLRTGKS